MRVLYISYDGMTDPLGQSQVLPYLAGLSQKGHRFVLLSFEKEERFNVERKNIEEICKRYDIQWFPMSYTKKPPVLSTLWDVFRLKRTIKQLHLSNPFDITHCRSHISSIGGQYLKKKFGVPFIFDMRGFYADERVDGGIWNLKKPLYKLIYTYFKKKEEEFLASSVYTISLTKAGADILRTWRNCDNIPLKVIPCCADLDFFKRENVKSESIKQWQNKLDIKENEFVISYLGSIGTWYMADEMFLFFKRLIHFIPDAKFLFITPETKEVLGRIGQKHDVPMDAIRVIRAKRCEVPELLMLSAISLFFIKPLFSKKSSSPVKMGEILSMGIPIIANRGVGDVDLIIEDTECGILVNGFDEESFDDAIAKISSFENVSKEVFTSAAEKYYSLQKGIEQYEEVYETVHKK